MEEQPTQISPEAPDLPFRAIAIGAAILVFLALIVMIWMPLPRVFAAPGEDRSATEPLNPNLRPLVDQAKKGDAAAMNALATVYMEGRQIPADLAHAVVWYRKAADAGDADAMNSVGVLALNGRGMPRDAKQAIDLFYRASQKGNAAAMLNLGVCCATGNGVTQEKDKAILWLKKAAAGNDANVRQQAQAALRQLGAQ